MSMESWIGPTPAGEFVALMVDGTLKSTVGLSLALLAERALRRSPAATRHGVLLAGLLSAPLAFTATALLQADAHWFGGLSAGAAATIATVYGLGVCAVVLPLLRSAWALRSVVRTSTAAVPWLPCVREPRADLRAADVAVPMTFGWLRPVVLIPRAAQGWSELERRSALAHELAHIRRRDWLIQLGAHGVLAALWFHPLAWMARSRLLLDAEQAADDAVLATGLPPSTYAEHLLTRCAELAGLRPAVVAMSPRGPKQLEQRVRAILAPSQPRGGSVWVAGLALAGLGALLIPLADASVVPNAEAPAPTCAVAEPSEPPSLERDVLRTMDGARAGLAYLQAELDALSMMELDARQSAAQSIVRNCPYRRAGLMVLATIRNELTKMEPATLLVVYPEGAEELLTRLIALQALVDQHWRYVETLGIAALPELADGDYLMADVARPLRHTTESLLQTEDPMTTASKGLGCVWESVTSMDQDTQDLLEIANAQIGFEHRNFLLDHLTLTYGDELLPIDGLATEIRMRPIGRDDTQAAGLSRSAQAIGLMALRLSILTQNLSFLGC